MLNRYIRCALVGFLGCGLVACATQPRQEFADLPGKDVCFWTRNLYDWTVIDDSTLIVHAPMPRDAYLIKLFAPIAGLDFHNRLGFQGGPSGPDQICGEDAYVVVGGPVPQREPITAVRTL